MWRLPNERPTSWPTMIPPRAGEITASQSNWRTLSASHPHTFAAMSVCSRSSAHWKYSRLCRPERKTKWPSSSAPVFLNSAQQIFAHFLVGRLTCSLPLARSRDLPVHVARLPPAPFCETPLRLASDTDAPQNRPFVTLPRCIIGGLVGFGCGGNYLDFHIGSFRQSGNLDGGPCRRILFEIRAVYLVYRLKIAEVR